MLPQGVMNFELSMCWFPLIACTSETLHLLELNSPFDSLNVVLKSDQKGCLSAYAAKGASQHCLLSDIQPFAQSRIFCDQFPRKQCWKQMVSMQCMHVQACDGGIG